MARSRSSASRPGTTAYGERWIEQLLARYNAEGPEALGDLRRRNGYAPAQRSKRVEFYTHEEGWKNKLICGDSLHVIESLLHYENLRGKVQMIYIDPPYGINYGSNFQQRVDSTTNDEKDTADDVLTIKAFRDTGYVVHSHHVPARAAVSLPRASVRRQARF